MSKYFLNNNHKFFYKFIISIMFINFSFYAISQDALENFSSQAKIFTVKECQNILLEYYQTNKITPLNLETLISDIQILTESLDKILLQNKNERDIETQNDFLLLFL